MTTLEKIKEEFHATAEMHEDGDYYLCDECVNEIIDKYAEQEPCEDAISREAVYHALDEIGGDREAVVSVDYIVDIIAELPSVTRQTGEWIESHVPESILCECSLCHFSCGAYSYNFCPNCGAKMESEDKE